MAIIRNFPFDPTATVATLESFGDQPVLLYINATWCGHCKRLRPTMEKVAGVLGDIVPVYSVDGDTYKTLLEQLRVQGFPTIIYQEGKGRRFEYKGERSLDAITSFVCQNATSPKAFCKRVR